MEQKTDELDIQMRLELFLVPSTYRALQEKAKNLALTTPEYISLLIHKDLKDTTQ